MSRFTLWIIAIIAGSFLISVFFGGLQMLSYTWGAVIATAYYEFVRRDK